MQRTSGRGSSHKTGYGWIFYYNRIKQAKCFPPICTYILLSDWRCNNATAESHRSSKCKGQEVFNMAIIEYYTKIFRKFIFIIYTYLGLRLSDNRRFARMPAFDSNCRCSLRSLSETKHRSTRKGGWKYCKRERGRYYRKTHWAWWIGGVGGSQMKVWGQHHFTYWFVPILNWNFFTFLIGLIELN